MYNNKCFQWQNWNCFMYFAHTCNYCCCVHAVDLLLLFFCDKILNQMAQKPILREVGWLSFSYISCISNIILYYYDLINCVCASQGKRNKGPIPISFKISIWLYMYANLFCFKGRSRTPLSTLAHALNMVGVNQQKCH